MKILAINPGSTSTKVAIFEDEKEIFSENIPISREKADRYDSIYDQLDMRYGLVLSFLKKNGFSESDMDAVVSRGGMLPPVKSGAYVIDDKLVEITRYRPAQIHASNLGALIADRIAKDALIPAYIYDPVSVDELSDVARLSGIEGRDRKSYSHALNTRAVAMRYCLENNLDYKKSTVIAAHLGGGISLNIQKNGKIIDVCTAEEGPFSSERAGGLQVFTCAAIAREEGVEALYRYERDRGGLASYLGTNDVRDVEKMIDKGDKKAKTVFHAMGYQIAKQIGALATVEAGKIDAILLTGGMAHSQMLVGWIKESVEFIAPVFVYPGEFEMQALAQGALRVMRGEEKAMHIVDINPLY
jgi:butyrate kinase